MADMLEAISQYLIDMKNEEDERRREEMRESLLTILTHPKAGPIMGLKMKSFDLEQKREQYREHKVPEENRLEFINEIRRIEDDVMAYYKICELTEELLGEN